MKAMIQHRRAFASFAFATLMLSGIVQAMCCMNVAGAAFGAGSPIAALCADSGTGVSSESQKAFQAWARTTGADKVLGLNAGAWLAHHADDCNCPAGLCCGGLALLSVFQFLGLAGLTFAFVIDPARLATARDLVRRFSARAPPLQFA